MESVENDIHHNFSVAFLRTEYYIRKSKAWINSDEFKKKIYSDIACLIEHGYQKILLRAPDIQLNELSLYDARVKKEDNSIIGHRGIRMSYLYDFYFTDFHALCDELKKYFTIEIDVVLPYVTQIRECESYHQTNNLHIMVETPSMLMQLGKHKILKNIKGYIIGLNDLYSLYFGAARQINYYRNEMSELVDFVTDTICQGDIQKDQVYWAGYYSVKSCQSIVERGFKNIIIDQKALSSKNKSMDDVWELYDKQLENIRRKL